MNKNIFFDLDGTIVDLYGFPDWLFYLRHNSAIPYAQAKPTINLSRLARALHKAQRNGAKIGVISWLSKVSDSDYDRAVTEAKLDWLARHLPSVRWDEIHIVAYGTPKSNFASDTDLLFDDEERNRNDWRGEAYAPEKIFEVLASL